MFDNADEVGLHLVGTDTDSPEGNDGGNGDQSN